MTMQPEIAESTPEVPEVEGDNEEAKEREGGDVTSPEKLAELVDKRVSHVRNVATETIQGGRDTIESAIASVGGSEGDAREGVEVLGPTQEKIEALAEAAEEEMRGASDLDTREGERRGERVALRDEYSQEELTKLREKTKEEYGEGLVKEAHRGAETLEEHEAAQREAYKQLEEKIESGVVKPDSITSDMLSRLELRDAQEAAIESLEQIGEYISAELKELTEKGFIKEDEAKLIDAEAEKFAAIYQEAFPDAEPQQVFEITRDNARKLAYQTERDKQVFSGSDHGTRHILEGNMKMADEMLDGLGDKISAKDKAMIHQIIVDHDLGYTVGIAQAKESFAASKDHPIFSTKFVEDNQEYYIEKFGEEGYEMIRDGILQHSYTQSEYDTPTDPEKGFNPDIIRSITSTVDALGVTAETKCPAFFREPEVISVLQKVRLYANTHGEEVPSDVLAHYKDELRGIADKEPDASRREGFYSAIENQFNPVTVEMTLGQYAGVLKEIQMTERDDKLVPHIRMDISKAQALLGDMFGDKLSTKAFVKAMEDFGISKESVADMADVIKQLREAKTEEEKQLLREKLTYSSDSAVFEFMPSFSEMDPEIEKSFAEVERLSIRNEIRKLLADFESAEARTSGNVEILLSGFNSAISEQMDADDMRQMIALQEGILSAVDNPAEFDKSIKSLETFITKQEQEFIGI